MAFNFFKKKQREKPKKTAESQVEKQLTTEAEPPERKEKHEVVSKITPDAKGKAKKTLSLPGVLLNPHITEKATMLKEQGQYVFRVHTAATKGAVRGAVESLYGVEVKKVRLIRKPAKKIRIGKKMGLKPGLKKAVVQLKPGQSIEVISR